jgi:raffinose/stachyose/melibiose transport system permease protein
MAEVRSLPRKIAAHVPLAIISLLVAVPLWYLLNNAFKVAKYISTEPMIITARSFTLANISNAFVALNYLRSFANSLIILAIACVLLVALGSLAGYAIGRVRSRILGAVYVVFVLTITFPFALAMVPLTVLLEKMHLANTYLGPALVYVASGMPFAVFLYTGYARTIPRELDEAAIVDGCGMFRSFLLIHLPLLRAITGTLIILRGVGIWNDLLIPILTISKARMLTLPQQLWGFLGFMRATYWDLIFAGTLLVSLPIILLFLFLQRYFTSGATAGALKQ